jgi:phage replication O-like protein O
MANPQKENGYTPIANELIEQLYKLPLNGTQFRIILVVFRYTYGFNRKEHELSETFIASALASHKRQIQRELAELIKRQILDVVKPATFNSSRVVKFNKHYDRWLISRQVTKTTPDDKSSVHTGDGLVTSRGGELVTQEIQIKDNIKDNIQQQEEKRMCEGMLFQFFNQNVGPITPFQSEVISQHLNDGMEPEMITSVLKDSLGKGERWTWIKKVLENSAAQNIKTLEQYEAKKAERQNAKSRDKSKKDSKPSNMSNFQQRKPPDDFKYDNE